MLITLGLKGLQMVHHLHHSNHGITFPSEITRRALIKGFGIGVGASLLSSLAIDDSFAATSTLPGFDAFSKSVKTLKSGKYYLVESNGIPSHNMMVGITNWQQQVPTVQPYTGDNAWKIPVKPVISKNPISAKNNLFRGAIALAVNGIPIFNAFNNRGEDSNLIGELDEWGGHCGRADDYHYHVAPLHLQKIVGKKKPIAYALDGFPIFGEVEVDGKAVKGLDEFNGHYDAKKNYHYHGTKTYPYINGGMRGVVAVAEGQISPQPETRPFREAGAPLRGAKIIAFEQSGTASYSLRYKVNELENKIEYSTTLASVEMKFTDSTGAIVQESYQRR